MTRNWKLVTAPSIEPVTLTEAKAHLRVDGTDEDTYITTLITVARRWCENYTGRSFISQQWDLFLSCFPSCGEIRLPRPDLLSISTFTYRDSAGTATSWTVSGDPSSRDLVSGSTTMAHIDTSSEPGRIVLAYGQSWPTATLRTASPIAIRYTAGYGTTEASVPDDLKHAILLIVGAHFNNREAVVIGDKAAIDGKIVPFAALALMADYVQRYTF